MSGGEKAIITPFLPALQGSYGSSPVTQTQLTVDGSGGTASDPRTQNEGKGFLGDQQLQLDSPRSRQLDPIAE